MNFLDALRSGSPFKRKHWRNWWELQPNAFDEETGEKIYGGWSSTCIGTGNTEPETYNDWTREDLLATDFETRRGFDQEDG